MFSRNHWALASAHFAGHLTSGEWIEPLTVACQPLGRLLTGAPMLPPRAASRRQPQAPLRHSSADLEGCLITSKFDHWGASTCDWADVSDGNRPLPPLYIEDAYVNYIVLTL